MLVLSGSQQLLEPPHFTGQKTEAQRLDQGLGASQWQSWSGIQLSCFPVRLFLEPLNFFTQHSFLALHSPAYLYLILFMCQALGHGVKIWFLPQRNSQSVSRGCVSHQRDLEQALWAAGPQRWLEEIKVEVFIRLMLPWVSFPQSAR